jgi:hypothetical protein
MPVSGSDGQPLGGYCPNCGSPLPTGAQYCPRCGSKTAAANAGGQQQPRPDAGENFRIGLLLIKIGAIVSVALSLLMLAGISWFSFLPGLPGPAQDAVTVFSSFTILGFVFAIVAAIFYGNIAGGNDGRIIHTIVLGVLMFFLSSNIAGALVGIGAYLCHVNKCRREARLS